MFQLLLLSSSGQLYKSTKVHNKMPNCISGTTQHYNSCLKFPVWSQIVNLCENDMIYKVKWFHLYNLVVYCVSFVLV